MTVALVQVGTQQVKVQVSHPRQRLQQEPQRHSNNHYYHGRHQTRNLHMKTHNNS